MSDDPTQREVDPSSDRDALGALAHRMNNALAYVVTNLDLLAEEFDSLGVPEGRRARLLQIVHSATQGAARTSELVRELRVLTWGRQRRSEQPAVDEADDTWESWGGARILVIDDEPQILTAIARVLGAYEVVQAPSGVDARRILAENTHFDLVLCDIMMRDVDGIEIFRWVVTRRPELASRLVFMTAGAFTTDIRRFLASVPNTVLHKPFDSKTLRWIVAQKLKETRR